MSDVKFICTYFDVNFLSRGLALFYSIRKYHSDFQFFALALDVQTFDYLEKLNEPQLKLISFGEYDSFFQTSKEKYSDIKQYYFSATPNICLYILERFPFIDILLYLDADVYAFNSLDPVYEEFGGSSIGLCSHRLNRFFRRVSNHYGEFNVGVNLFRNNNHGIRCLQNWKSECDSWYPGKPGYPLSFFSDQIFLDSWEGRYEGVRIIKNVGVNTAPWNAINYRFRKINDVFYVDDQPLIIFHFSSLRKLDDYTWNANTIYYFTSVRNVLSEIYREYITVIESFGLASRKLEIISHKDKMLKKFFKMMTRPFIKEFIVMDHH